MSLILAACFGIDVLVSVYYSLLWHATTLVSFIYTWSLLPAISWSFIIVVKSCCYCC